MEDQHAQIAALEQQLADVTALKDRLGRQVDLAVEGLDIIREAAQDAKADTVIEVVDNLSAEITRLQQDQ